jgi:hypothetical protein
MEFLFADIFFGTIGWTFLFFKYRNIKKMTLARDSEYDGFYSTAGRTIALQAFLILLGLLVLGMLIAGIIGTIRNLK